ncbi:CheR family methyltransferase [uncultured Sphingomonas sp.]|uniref:CheR family methyltransferase n=1 Tax=uncultured Sphingomonas sp. TaxID=158754 RepID=UPI0035CC3C00
MLSALPTGTSGAINALAALLEAHTGQQIAPSRNWRIESTLAPLMRQHGWADLNAVVMAIRVDSGGTLAIQVVEELLNQESSFFRDAATFDLVADVVAATCPDRRPRIWSAGCSTGQEPLSLAMQFVETLPEGRIPEIVATDISEAALQRARAGRYSQFEIQRGLPIGHVLRWFEQVEGDWVADPALVRRISFRRMNLVADPSPVGRFDMILCRNVLLYFSPALRRRVLCLLAQALRPDGVLVLGAGETVIGQTDALRPSPRFRGLYEPMTRGCIAAA